MTTQTTPTDQVFATFMAMLIDTLAMMVPAKDDGSDATAIRRDIARMLFDALKPRDAVEAMLAARAIAAHHATMDGYARAAQPGTSDENSIRLRANAIAASRSFDAVLRTLEKRRKEPDAPAVETAANSDGRPDEPVGQQVPCRSDGPPSLPHWRDETAHTRRRTVYSDGTALASTPPPLVAMA